MLLKPSKLLGVGFKGDHGLGIGQAKFHNLEREVELVHACQLVEVFVKQPLNDQGPPKYCVVAPERAAAFGAGSRVQGSHGGGRRGQERHQEQREAIAARVEAMGSVL